MAGKRNSNLQSCKKDTSLPFRPSPAHLAKMPEFKRNFRPRYLFRVYSPETAGMTTENFVLPRQMIGTERKEAKDIFRMEPNEAADLLNAHLRWWGSHQDSCSLISWTTSLLFALQYGLYKFNQEPKASLSRIHLLVIDTTAFSKGTFVKDLEIMEALAALSDPGRCKKDLHDFLNLRQSGPHRNGNRYYFGEYLTQGLLDIQDRCANTSFQSMIDNGLFELCEGLGDQKSWSRWVDRVLVLRQINFSQSPILALDDEVSTSIDIAEQCFGDTWTAPITLMLLSLKKRSLDDKAIIRGLKDRFDDDELRCCLPLITVVIPNDQPDVLQFKELAGEIMVYITGEGSIFDRHDITKRMGNLTLGENQAEDPKKLAVCANQTKDH